MTYREFWRAHRVLHPVPIESFERYVQTTKVRGLRTALAMQPVDIRAVVLASGLRGRGGAGFPVGTKWSTVADNAAQTGLAPTVVVNIAEGEPGTFKDRSIIQNNPFQVISGALIAARAISSTRIVLAIKEDFAPEVLRLEQALQSMADAGWVPFGTTIDIVEGPDEYLFGEESALLEVIDGREPFPRLAPTFRVGLLGEDRGSRLSQGPALVNNLESIANIPKIVARGAKWFRQIGTKQSPGSVVCTVTGDTKRHGVGEVRLGTPLRQVIHVVGGGPALGQPIKAVLAGVANPIIPARHLNQPVSYEDLRSIGTGFGSGGFIVFGEGTDMVAVAAGVSRFLSVESCGQCSPCKLDGLRLTSLLEMLAANQAAQQHLDEIRRLVETVAYGARCFLATQQELVLSSILREYEQEFVDHVDQRLQPTEPVLVAELKDICDGVAVLDERHWHKQPDWSFNASYSGYVPVEIRSPSSSPLQANLLPPSGW